MEANSETASGGPDFSGKVLNLTLIDDEADRDLVSPTFEMQAGRLFLVGVVPPGATTSGWSMGAVSAVAWDRVTSYLVFGSMDQYAAAVQRSRERDSDEEEPT